MLSFFVSWEQRKLKDFVDFFNGQTYSPSDVQEHGTLVLRSSNVQNGEISKEDCVFISNSVVNSNNVEIGDIIVVVRNGSRNLIGKHAKIKAFMPNTVIGAFMTGIRTKDSNFVNALLNTQLFENEINKNMGATINQITGYMFSNMEFYIPKSDEQLNIGKLFLDIDNLITLHQRKGKYVIKDEKEYKKNYNITWEQRKLNEYLETSTEKNEDGTYTKEDVLSVSGEVGIVNQIELQGRSFAGASVLNYGIVNTNDVVYTKSPLKINPYGIIKTNKGKAGIVSTLYAIYHPKKCTNSKFVQTYFELDYRLNKYLHPLVKMDKSI